MGFWGEVFLNNNGVSCCGIRGYRDAGGVFAGVGMSIALKREVALQLK